MAEALGVAKSQVHRDAQAGMPMHSVDAARAWRLDQHDMSRTVEGRIDRPATDSPPAAVSGLASAAGAGEAGTSPASPDAETPLPGDVDTAEYRKARSERERTAADRAQLELDQLRGRLIDVSEAKRLAFTSFRSLRDAVLQVPARVAALCAAQSEPLVVEQIIEAELVAVLSAIDPAKLLVDADQDDEG
jgi:hypothetical protein